MGGFLFSKPLLAIFKKAGYRISVQGLDASFCGVPQARKRFFLAGHTDSDRQQNKSLAVEQLTLLFTE